MKPTIGRPQAGSKKNVPSARNLRSRQFASSVVAELRRVTWPSRQEWVSATVLTIALVVVVGLFTAVVDKVVGYLFGLVTGS